MWDWQELKCWKGEFIKRNAEVRVRIRHLLRRAVIQCGRMSAPIAQLASSPCYCRRRERCAVASSRSQVCNQHHAESCYCISSNGRNHLQPVRAGASQFFTSLRSEVDKGDTSNFTQAQREGMQPLFVGPDCSLVVILLPQAGCPICMWAYRKIMNG